AYPSSGARLLGRLRGAGDHPAGGLRHGRARVDSPPRRSTSSDLEARERLAEDAIVVGASAAVAAGRTGGHHQRPKMLGRGGSRSLELVITHRSGQGAATPVWRRTLAGYHSVKATAPAKASTVAAISTASGIDGTYSAAASAATITAKAPAHTDVISR